MYPKACKTASRSNLITLPLIALPMHVFIAFSEMPAGSCQRLGDRPWSRNSSSSTMNLPLWRSQWPPSVALAAVRQGVQFIMVLGARFLTLQTAGVRCGSIFVFTNCVSAATHFRREPGPFGNTDKSTGVLTGSKNASNEGDRLAAVFFWPLKTMA